jgi:hypothetical protein
MILAVTDSAILACVAPNGKAGRRRVTILSHFFTDS